MFSRLRSFLTAWTRRERFEDSLDEEVRFHLDAYAEDLVHSGVPRRDAVRQARIRFGSIESMKDDCRQARGLRLADDMATVVQDIRLALRVLLANRGFAAAILLTVALGVGGTAAVFSVVHGVLLRPLPYAEPERLVRLFSLVGGVPGLLVGWVLTTAVQTCEPPRSWSWLTPVAATLAPADFPRLQDIRVDMSFLVAGGVVAVVVGSIVQARGSPRATTDGRRPRHRHPGWR